MKQLTKTTKSHVKMTYDIVFKKFFTDKPELLKLVLKHFLGIDSIRHLTIANPEIPELDDKKQAQAPAGHLIKEDQEENSTKRIKWDKSQENDQTKKFIKESLKSGKKGLSFLDSSLPPETIEGKRVFLDLRVKLVTGEDINVEMQSYYEPNLLRRILYYWARLHAQSLKTGEGYESITPTYSLIFTEKPVLDKQVRDFISSFSIRRDEEPYILFNKDLKIVIVELSKLKKSGADLFDFKEFWCYFIKEADRLTREDRKRLSKYKEMEEAMDHFDKLSQEERLRNIALDRHMADVIHGLNRQAFKEEIQKVKEEMQKAEEEMQKGREQGRKEGREEKLQELIWNMLQEGVKISVISKVTGLSEDEVLKVKK